MLDRDSDALAHDSRTESAALGGAMAALAVGDDARSVSSAASAEVTAPAAAAPVPPANAWEASVALDESGYYDHIEIEDMEFDEDNELYHYPCPCGDRFEITLDMLRDGEDVATCPSCSLLIKVIYDAGDLFSDGDDDDEIQLDTTITVC
ncbi:Diphthamide biosynthesis protein 3 [Coemansia spiralis]|nr:Diphthamide biosynthesis protein 3 [Coemansia spiralis]